MSDVFLSYAREDREVAQRLADVLKADGWDVWWDPNVPTGSTFDAVIEEALETARSVVVLWSRHSVKSHWVRTEAQEGQDKNALLPARIEDVKPPLAFRRFQAANLVGWQGGAEHAGVQDLLRDLRALLHAPGGASREPLVQEPIVQDETRDRAVPVAAPAQHPRREPTHEPRVREPAVSRASPRRRARRVLLVGVPVVAALVLVTWAIVVFAPRKQPPGDTRAPSTDQAKPVVPPPAPAGGNASWIEPTAASLAETPSRPALARIPPGLLPATFKMGSPSSEDGRSDDEGPVHDVTFVRPYLIAATETTQAQYGAVVGTKPSSHAGCNGCPVENVSWLDALRFCNALSLKEGLRPCYDERDSDAPPDARCTGYRLPTEAEWEYAARAGTTAPYLEGANETDLDRFAWYEKNASGQAHPVGEKAANPWGLHDVLGNVWEWVEDDWHGNYDGAPRDGSAWVEKNRAAIRVIRGGSWADSARYCRVAFRSNGHPAIRIAALGFRVARSLPSTP